MLSNHLGKYQFHCLTKAMVAGTKILRTINASTNMATAIPRPNSFTMRTSATINDPHVTMTIMAALVIIRLLCAIP